MEINGKDFLEWLHDVRRSMREEEQKSGRSETESLAAHRREAEAILGGPIPKVSERLLVKP